MDTELLFNKEKQADDEYLIEKRMQDYEKIFKYYYDDNSNTKVFNDE